MHLLEKPWRVCRSCEAWKWHSSHQSQSFESSKPNSSIYSCPCSICWASEAQGGAKRHATAPQGAASHVGNCILGGILCHLILTSLQGSYTFVGGTWHLSKVSMEFLRGWREDWPGKNDETWTFWRHIGPLGRTVWGLDRIPLKDLKVGEEVDGRVKGRYRSMGWFLVRKVSLEGGHSLVSKRSHLLLSCASVPSWNDRLGHTGPQKCWSGETGTERLFQVYIYISFEAFTVSSFNLIPFLTSPSYLNRQWASQNFRNKKTKQHASTSEIKHQKTLPKKTSKKPTKAPPPLVQNQCTYYTYTCVWIHTISINCVFRGALQDLAWFRCLNYCSLRLIGANEKTRNLWIFEAWWPSANSQVCGHRSHQGRIYGIWRMLWWLPTKQDVHLALLGGW